jgi:hypothetical protein
MAPQKLKPGNPGFEYFGPAMQTKSICCLNCRPKIFKPAKSKHKIGEIQTIKKNRFFWFESRQFIV